jgi:hypothetical protein
MRIKKFWFLSFVICLSLSFSAFSQLPTKVNSQKAVKELRQNLIKNSRYQYENFTIIFRPVEFNDCNIKYRFETIEGIGNGTATSSATNSSPLDSYERTRIQPPHFVTGREGTGSFIPGRKDEERNRQDEIQRSRAFVETLFNLGDVDPNSLKILDLPGGIFLAFQIKENKNLISKLPSDGKSEEAKKDEVFPVISMDKAEELKDSFFKAIKQCQ